VGRLRNTIYFILAFFAALFGFVLYWHNSIFILEGPEHGFLLTKSKAVRQSIYLPAFYIHITTGSLVLVTGIVQLSKKIRHRYASLHRALGKVYVAAILFISAPSGFIMSFFANGGWPAQLGFGLLSIMWWWFTFAGWKAATLKTWHSHRNFTIRSYALTFAAVTLRMYSFIFALMGYRGDFIYNIMVWLSWVPSLILAELWLRKINMSLRQDAVDVF
jgi:hypothetical protein